MGSIDTAMFECLERMDSSGYMSVQVEALKNHDKTLQMLLLEKAELKNYLPSLPNPVGYKFVDHPYAKSEDIDDDDKDLEDDAQTLSKDCPS